MINHLSRNSRLLFAAFIFSTLTLAAQTAILQPLSDKPVPGASVKLKSDYYVPVTPDSIRWGYLPDNAAKPIISINSGATVTFDTLSHEGILEDQGRDPAKYFASFGVPADQVLNFLKMPDRRPAPARKNLNFITTSPSLFPSSRLMASGTEF